MKLIKIKHILSKTLGVLLPKKKKLIVFESFLGRQFSDNPKALYDFLQENDYDFNCYWSIDGKYENKFKNKNLKTIKRFSFRWIYIMARSKYWVSNSRIPLWVYKSKNTVYLQTWHGTPLKKLALDMDKVSSSWRNPHLYKKDFVSETSRWDYLVSPNRYSTEIFYSAFDFNNTMIESGYPRNDFLINGNNTKNINKIKEKIGIPKNKKIIFYAPTWRDNFSFDLPISITNLKKHFGDEYYIIFRFHYLVTRTNDLIGHEDFVKNLSSYNDINELYLISDVLITDYSSVFFDYAVLNRPMIFYCYDLELYKNELRGFYFDFEHHAPGPIVKTTDELIKVLKNIDDYKPPKQFIDQFTSLENGHSSQKVLETVLNV